MRPKEGTFHFTISWLVVILAVWQLYRLFPSLDLDQTGEFMVIIFLGVLAEWLAVSFPHGQLSGSFTLIMATFLIYGPAAAAWISGLATVVGQGIANRGNPLRTTLFNTGQYVLAVVAAGLAFLLCGGVPGLVSLPNALPLGAFTVTYIVVNHLMVYFYLLPQRRRMPHLAWLDTIKWDGLTYLFTVPLGLLIAMIHSFVGMAGALMLFFSVLGLQLILRFSVRLQVTNQELTAFYETARYLEENPGSIKILEQVLTNARKALTYHSAVAYFRSGESDTYLPAAMTGPYSKQLNSTAVYTGEGITGWVLANREAEIIYDARLDSRTRGDTGLCQVMRSLIVAPLCAGGETLGVVVLGEKRPLAFDENHLHIMAVLCSQAAVAVENSILHDRLGQASSRDNLTGLMSFSSFAELAAGMCKSVGEAGYPVGMVLVDIDRFKAYNLRYGREAGERVLAELSMLVEEGTRRDDLIARYGGNEFILLLPGAEGSRLMDMAESLRERVREHAFRRAQGVNTRITVSIGLAEFPRDAGDLAGLLLAGQRALDKAKEAGGNRVVSAAVSLVK
ncbi:MAG: sensor domain-containing diguanylate cyclase [Desulfotomaculaceae bacterium]|nr:sensor domain-containing diguanylate cyclase [Desulfotomaculaceae bacterium]